MKPLSDMTHYEILELAPGASPDDVERAYRVAAATYGEESLATYSLYEDSEVAAIRERIEHAYRVLADNEARDDYDRGMGGMGEPEPEARREVEIELDFEPEVQGIAGAVAPEIEEFADLEDPGDPNFDGARLRRTRLARGFDIDRIAAVTKINPTYLTAIEEDRFTDLPADVYVRGFVSAYARCVGLDPDRVAPVYLERVRAARPDATAIRASRRR